MKLNPNTTYDFNKADDQFILELSKIGYVHKLSNQVTLIELADSKDFPNASLSFKEFGNPGCDGLQLPTNWVIEHVSFYVNKLTMTFKINKEAKL